MGAGAHAYKKQLNEGPRPLIKAKKVKTKQKLNKRNAKERQRDIRREDTGSRCLWLVNYDERISTDTLALGYPLLDPSRHVVGAYCCVP